MTRRALAGDYGAQAGAMRAGGHARVVGRIDEDGDTRECA